MAKGKTEADMYFIIVCIITNVKNQIVSSTSNGSSWG